MKKQDYPTINDEDSSMANESAVALTETDVLTAPPRAGWTAAAKQVHIDGEDKLMVADFFDDEKMEDWQW